MPQPVRRGGGQQCEGERQVVDQIPAEQPPRLAGEPERPFQAGALHPLRRPGQRPGRERDRCAAAHEPGAGEGRGKAGDQAFLLGEPEPNEDDAGGIARDLYGLETSAGTLPSERDQNFLLQNVTGEKFVLKIADAE